MNVITNMKVNTPIGEGVVQGPYAMREGDESVLGALVRLPVNEVTRAYLGHSHCLTPRASVSALFVFAEGALA